MKLFNRLLILFLFIMAPVRHAYAIQSTRLFDSREIVSSNYSSFCVDKDGNLWIGTQYGLLRFDGNNFDKYLHDENSETSLSDNRILNILRDSSDRLWIGTCEGLNLYNPDTDDFSRVKLPNSELLGYIFDIWQLSDDNIVFMVSGVGLHILDFSSGDPVAVKYMSQIENTSTINTLCETEKGELVGGNHYGEIIKIAPNGQSKTYNITDSYIQILLRNDEGNIFVATTSKCWLWNPKNDIFHPIAMPEGMNPELHCAELDEDGNILVGTMGDGLLRLEKHTLELKPYRELNNPIVNMDRSRISIIHQESSGNLWLGCPYQGIIMVPKREIPFNFVNIARALPEYAGGKTNVGMAHDSNIIWVGLENGELISIDESGNLLKKWHLGGDISSLHISDTNKIYAGIDNHGLYELDPVSGVIRQLVNIKGHYIAVAITEDHAGNIYLGVHGEGVIKVNPDTKEAQWLHDTNKNARHRWISSLFCDSKDRIWIGMYGGLAIYDIATNRHTSLGELNPQLVKGVHNSIREDANGKIWDATSNGLFIINPDDNSYRRLTPNDGLSDIYVSTIVFDNENNAWVGTHCGLNRVDTDFNVTPFYGQNDMSDNDYFSATISPDGNRLLFSGEKGITLLEPAKLKKPMFENDIFISGIYLNGNKVNNATLTSSGEKVLPEGKSDPERIRLSFRDNSLVLRMSTKDFRDTDNLMFQWRVPGIIDDWISTSPGSSVIALPHFQTGDYRLEIRAAENGLYSNIRTVAISVSSPWYLSFVARFVYLLLLCSIIVLAWREIKHKNTERDNEEKIKFFINISHEIRSPLTLILSPLERIMKKQHDPETTKNLNAIHRNANRILGLINQLLDIRKIDKGKMKIKHSETEFISFTSELVDIFKPQAEEKGLNLQFEVADPTLDSLTVWIDRNNFDKVLVNLISNAIKYTPAGGEITVSVGHGSDTGMGDYAEVKVTDTGIGLDEKNISRLFDRFYQGKFNRSDIPLGFGIGLDLCRLLVELHNGTITAANRTDRKGSCFTVRIPVRSMENEESDDNIESVESERNIMPPTAPLLQPESKRTSKNSSLKILIVDDDAEIRSFLNDILSGFGKVTEAINGEEAMRSIMESMPDLIISDVVMPCMDGLTLLKALKSNVDTNHIPVILLSSKNDVTDRMAGWDKGADGYIGKPFIVEELQAMVDNLIDNRLRLKGKFSGTQQQEGRIETPDLKGNDKMLIDKIVSEIDNHLDDPNLNVEKLCQEVGLSRAHLNRKMKELFGLTPSEFIRNVRLRKACELLHQPDVDISQIAYSVGFSSQPHFSTAFKRFTGISPTEYRQKNSKETV